MSDQQLVPLHSLAAGQVFLMPWRDSGRNIGEVIRVGLSSVDVKIPDYIDGKLDTTYVSRETLVVPTSRAEFNTQRSTNVERNRSAIDNPVDRVHAICASMPKATVKDVIAKCVAEGINKNTAKTQFYAWKRKQS